MLEMVLNEPGNLGFRPATCEPLPDSWARVRVHCAGVCGTDLHAYKGRQPFFTYPRVLGHELAVEILEIRGESGFEVGARCAVRPYWQCGKCPTCLRGKTNCCEFMQVLGVHRDGGFRPEIDLPLSHLHPATGVNWESLAMVEPLAIGVHAVSRSGADLQDIVVVTGAGPIGLAVASVLTAQGIKPWIADLSHSRLEFCHQLGHSRTIQLGEGKTIAQNLPSPPTVIFDATGHPGSMMQSFADIAHGGRIVFVGLCQSSITFDDPLFHRKELTLMATRNALPNDFSWALDQVARGAIQPQKWITHRCRFESAAEMFPTWLDPQSHTVKALIEMQ